jgi:hypothetical protein
MQAIRSIMTVAPTGHIQPSSPLQGYARQETARPNTPGVLPDRQAHTDTVHISGQGRRKALGKGDAMTRPMGAPVAKPDGDEISPEEQQALDRLKKRDQEVRAHEAAHMAAGSGLVSGATYQYAVGPDGKRYVTGGEVQIDTSEEKDPRATIRKMQQVRRAALAPAQPSGTDRSVAAHATKVEQNARLELSEEAQPGKRAEVPPPAGGIGSSQPPFSETSPTAAGRQASGDSKSGGADAPAFSSKPFADPFQYAAPAGVNRTTPASGTALDMFA